MVMDSHRTGHYHYQGIMLDTHHIFIWQSSFS